jgi:hypothetical protein
MADEKRPVPTWVPEKSKFEIIDGRCYYDGRYCGSLAAINKINLYPPDPDEKKPEVK